MNLVIIIRINEHTVVELRDDASMIAVLHDVGHLVVWHREEGITLHSMLRCPVGRSTREPPGGEMRDDRIPRRRQGCIEVVIIGQSSESYGRVRNTVSPIKWFREVSVVIARDDEASI